MQPSGILVQPRHGGGGGQTRPANREEASDDYEEESADWDPYGAGEDDERCKEDESDDGNSDGDAGEEEQDGAGDYKSHYTHELGRVEGVLTESADEWSSIAAGGGSWWSLVLSDDVVSIGHW